MADIKNVKVAADTIGEAPQSVELVRVDIPATDMYDYPHPGIGHNHDHFKAGETYFLPKPVADEVMERLKIFDRQNLKVLQPRIDQKAVRDLAKQGRAEGVVFDAGTR